MRAFGKVMCGVGVATIIYFCVDIFLLGSKKSSPQPSSSLVRETATAQEVRRPLARPIEPPAQQVIKPQPAKPPAVEQVASDQTNELVATLEAEYATDTRATPGSYAREELIGKFFSGANLGGKGHLQQVTCREKICRGVIQIANERADNEVFAKTFLSTEFMTAVPDAISIASRQKALDGSILATFFIHPQSIFAMLPQPSE